MSRLPLTSLPPGQGYRTTPDGPILEILSHGPAEYMRLRVVPVELAGQFRAMAAPGRRVQALPGGAGQTIVEPRHG